MSRVGKKPIKIADGVTVDIDKKTVKVLGSKGELHIALPKNIEVSQETGILTVVRKSEDKQTKSNHGAVSSLIENAIKGVSEGWTKTMELIGTGYRGRIEGEALILAIGYSHPIKFDPPSGIKFGIEENKVTVSGIDRHLVGQISANVRAVRPPDAYKGKGVKYINEIVRRKPGKAAKTAA